MMHAKQGGHSKGFWRELALIVRRARQVWRLVPHRHKLAFGGAALVMALTSACNTALPLLIAKLVNVVAAGHGAGQTAAALFGGAVVFLLLIAAAYLVREVLQVVRRYLVENSCTRIDKVMTTKLVAHLLKVDLASFTHEKIGALHGRITRSVLGYIRLLRLAFLDFFPPLLSGVFAIATALYKQPWMGLAMAGVIPISLFLTVRQLISQKGIRIALMRSRELMDGTVVEQLAGLDYIRAANTFDREVERVARAAEKRRAKEIRHHFQMSLYGCAKALNEGFFHIVVISLAIYLAARGTIDIGDIFAFSGLFLAVMAPLNEVHRALDEGHECSLLVADLLEMLSEPVDDSFSPRETEEPRLGDERPAVVVENLQVEYRTSDAKLKRALDGISMTIRHGETIGVAGPSGSGKSTWLRVLMRLTHPKAGKVLLGGVPLENVSREAVGRLIGYVSQYPFVFAGTIAENIAYGTENASPEDVRRAAEMACVHDEIMDMPGGYDAEVSERGQNLSGGQRQRLALARAFLKNPPILILDEGTSALDTINERRVQRAIEAARADRTVILVAHRLSTLLDADRILVFENGRIVEAGTYGGLMNAGGAFSRLLRSAQQTRPEEESGPQQEEPARPEPVERPGPADAVAAQGRVEQPAAVPAPA